MELTGKYHAFSVPFWMNQSRFLNTLTPISVELVTPVMSYGAPSPSECQVVPS